MKAGWEIKKLGDVCQIIGGGTPSKANDEFYNGKILWATVRDMKFDMLSETEHRITEKAIKSSATNIIPKGNVVIATRVGLGKVCLLENDTAINQDLRGVIPKYKGKLSEKYLFFWFRSIAHLIEQAGTGATVHGVKLPFVKSLEIPVPPLPEQRRIVAILDEAFAGIAAAKENAEQNLKNAKEVFEAYSKDIFSSQKAGWEEKTIDKIAKNLDSKRIPVTKNKRKAGNIPYYGASGIVDYIEDYIFEDDLLCISEDGANLIARTYPIAFSISGKTWVNNHAHVLKFKNVETQRFVQMYINSINIEKYVNGMAQPKLNQAMLNNIPVPFPPLNEQKIIVSQLDSLSAETSRLESIYQQKLSNLQELKKSLLQQAFSGAL